jgi:hypothetical protein
MKGTGRGGLPVLTVAAGIGGRPPKTGMGGRPPKMPDGLLSAEPLNRLDPPDVFGVTPTFDPKEASASADLLNRGPCPPELWLPKEGPVVLGVRLNIDLLNRGPCPPKLWLPKEGPVLLGVRVNADFPDRDTCSPKLWPWEAEKRPPEEALAPAWPPKIEPVF